MLRRLAGDCRVGEATLGPILRDGMLLRHAPSSLNQQVQTSERQTSPRARRRLVIPSREGVLLLRAPTGGPTQNVQNSAASTTGMRFLARCLRGELGVQGLKVGQDFCVF